MKTLFVTKEKLNGVHNPVIRSIISGSNTPMNYNDYTDKLDYSDYFDYGDYHDSSYSDSNS